ncbi:MAG: hypothetical protein SNJ69_00205 [Chloroflexaceae bacterium]
MDLKLNERRAATEKATREGSLNPERMILTYWAVATLVGSLVLWDWIGAWNVPATLQVPGLPIYLVLTFALSQVLYLLVARFDGRPIHWGATAVFALGNGIAETLAFGVVYRLGETIGAGIVGLFLPSLASFAGFLLGVVCFVVYGGLIHGFFWLQMLPPHLDDSPRSRKIRKLRPMAEVALVLGWSLCFWLTRDLWTVAFFHILVDIGLMLKVRPPIFGARSAG